MMLLSALVVISSIGLQSGSTALAGRVVPIVYPDGVVRQVPEDVKSWDGFAGANATGADWPTAFESHGDWQRIRNRISSFGELAPDAPVWRTKVFILTNIDRLVGGDARLLPSTPSTAEAKPEPFRQSRHRLNGKQVDGVLKSIARLHQYARAASGGVVKFEFDVEIDGEPIVIPPPPAPRAGVVPITPANQFLAEYIYAKVNRGAFAAEDKKFRGPFDSILVITADPQAHGTFWNRDLGNVHGISGSARIDEENGFGLDDDMIDAFAYTVMSAEVRRNIYRKPVGGVAGMSRPYLPSLFQPDEWKIYAGLVDPTFEQTGRLYQLAGEPVANAEPIYVENSPAPFSSNVTVTIASDGDRGQVLKYSEQSMVRYGGFSLPYKVDVEKTPYLKFWAKTASKDPLALFGRYETKGIFAVGRTLAIPNDGAWHPIVVDLRLRPGKPLGFYLGAPWSPDERQQVGEIAYFLDDFSLSADGTPTQTGEPNWPAEYNEALAAKTLSAADLLKSNSDMVRLNGLMLRETPFTTADEASLIELTKSPNARVAGEAVQRLAQIGTDTAKAEVLRLVTSSPYEHVKQVAAVEVGRMGDPKMAGILSRLFASRFWQTRLAGAKAITMLPGDDAAVISMTFLQETDPLIRYTLTRSANTENAVVLKRFLWSTVNDPSDAVRAESAWRLIQSGKPREAAEGYKAIRDESIGVRLDLLSRMSATPAEAHRAALRIAVTDLSPRVRAAALAAWTKHPGELSLDEIANTFSDKLPIVQLALIELAKSRKLTLPPQAIATLNASIDPRVVEGVKEISN